ncbi:MAG: Bax inhibitor-1/YccA family protein [Micavibrio sp.]|jgi:FtsH-binding integral membrane protein|nr:MAG: Bax inhibitor-1/YccA family protein [Micavibrio sp.]
MNTEPKKTVHDLSGTSEYTGIVDAGLREHMRKVYNMMCFGLLVTGLSAMAVANIEPLYQAIFTTPLRYVAMFGPFLFLFFGLTPGRVAKMSASAVHTTFVLFTVSFGVCLSYIFHHFSGESIARVFFITAGMFAGISILGYTTRRDLTSMGSMMIMGFFGFFIAAVVNIFFLQSLMLHFITSVVGVIVFTGLTAWQTQSIKEQYDPALAQEDSAKMAVLGAFSLYLYFVMLFQQLMHLFGRD